jgi:integrase/recombinase XerD
MPNLSQEIAINIINEVIKIVPYFDVDIQQQVKLRDKIEEQLNDYEVTSKCTALARCDILDKAFIYLACKKLEGMKETTRYNYTLLLKRLDGHFNKPISTITTMDLRMFLASEYKDNQPNSLNSKISLLKAFFIWLQDEGYIVQNPTKNLQQAKEPYRRRGHVTPIDVEKMREECKSVRDKALFEILLSTGCRVSEITNATLDKIDWQNNSIEVIGKGDKERMVYFSTRARLFLINYISDREKSGILSNSLFAASKKPYLKLGRRSIERIIGDIAERAGISYSVFPHLMRHTFATTGVNQDVPVHILQKLMGHSSPGVTEKYYDLNDNNIKQEYRKIAL